MGSNITTRIRDIKDDKRQSADTRSQAKSLMRVVGTNKPVPVALKKRIMSNPSSGEAVVLMRKYVEKR